MLAQQQYLDSNEIIFREDESFDLKKWFFRIIRMWPWFLLSILVCFSCAWLYLRYANPVYQSVASIMIKDEQKGGVDMTDNLVLTQLGLSGTKVVENELEILRSYDLMESVVRELSLFYAIDKIGNIQDVNVFGDDAPVTIEIPDPLSIKKKISWTIIPYPDSYLFKSEDSKKTMALKYGQMYRILGISFRIMPNSITKNDTIPREYRVSLNTLNDATAGYNKNLTVLAVSKTASVINLQINDHNRKKAVAVLKTLIAIYNKQGLEDKNRVTDNTIDFLNERLKSVAKELQGVEGAVENFKSQNRITDISADAQQYIAMAQQIDIQKAQSETQMNIITALERELLLNQENPQLMPSTLGIQEPSMAALIERHNELVLLKERTIQKSGPENPLLIDLQGQIKEIRGKLLSNVRSLKQAYEISLNDISQKDAMLSNRIRNVPLLEKKLVQIKRDQNVQEQLYAFLLQKREESALALASSVEDSRTIVKSRSIGKISPRPNIAWAIATLLSILIPAGVIGLKDFLNNRIGDQEQIQKKVSLPLLGSISHIKKMKGPVFITPRSRSVAAEQMRHIRTSISFAKKDKEVKTILITSFQPGDGKSFISLNLAASYALLNKKTVLLEFDMRKPQISKLLKIEQKKGISSLLVGKAALEEIVVEIEEYDKNLYFLPAGYVPPNPAELISGKNMDDLMKKLREQFEFIIIDTPPFSLVTDAMLLQHFADIAIIVLRQSHTSKNVYSELKSYYEKQPEHSTYLLLNDVGKKKRYQNNYGAYKYGKGYYNEEKKNGIWFRQNVTNHTNHTQDIL